MQHAMNTKSIRPNCRSMDGRIYRTTFGEGFSEHTARLAISMVNIFLVTHSMFKQNSVANFTFIVFTD